ncbi:MAG TPA: type VI secretion system baseplate subunit TssF [Planctomycetaceae bacterium]|nr:type VI secretion system baseplate subunit TssF [Planctomycetaceae bacterium]
MQDDLLRWYNNELGFLRRMGEEFAREHPKIASRLKLGPESSQDPHVERLIEAVAFLNARTRQKIDDDFPELSNAILEVLQPQFLAPIPSMMITQFKIGESEANSVSGYTIERGTSIETESIQGEPCRFRTSNAVTIWPVQVQGGSCHSRPFKAPMTKNSKEAAGVIHLTLKTRSPEFSINQIEWESLRFYLSGLPQITYPLYETLCNNVTEIAFARSVQDENPLVYSPDIIRQVGFEPEDILLPGSERTAWEHRLLTEFFVFPEKFLFFDLEKLDLLKESDFTEELHIFFYLNETLAELENDVTASTFQLGCTPTINLFKQRADPIYLTQTEFEYPVCGDVRRPDAVEIYSIDEVTAQDSNGDEFDFQPFYSVDHLHEGAGDQNGFWHSIRRDSKFSETDAQSGSEVFISFVDLSFTTIQRDDWIVNLETTCLNRNLPEKLPYGRGQPKLYFSEEAGAVSDVLALSAPTATVRPPMLNHARWKLISNLSLDHLSLVGDDEAAKALREILAIYDFEESSASRNMIQAIKSVTSRRVTRRIHESNYSGVSRGIEVTVTFDSQVDEPKLFLLACVIERFLGQACTLNSFSQLIVQSDNEDVIWKKWAPRTGSRILL